MRWSAKLAAHASAVVDQVQNRPLRLTDDGRVRFRDEIAHSGRMPVVASGEPAFLVHALLNDGPFTGLINDEGMQVELEAIGDGVVVDPGGETAGTGKVVAV